MNPQETQIHQALTQSLQNVVTALDQFSHLVAGLNQSMHGELQKSLDRVVALQSGQGAPMQQPQPGYQSNVPPGMPGAPAGVPSFPAPGQQQAPIQYSGPQGGPAGIAAMDAAAQHAGVPATVGAAVAQASAGTRKRRTKAQIEADEAAIRRGYTSAADEQEKLGANGGGTPGAGFAQQPPVMQQTAMAPGVAPVQAMQPMQQPMPVAQQAAPAGSNPSTEDVIAAFQQMITAVDAVWPGHGAGQAGLLLNTKCNTNGSGNVHMIPENERPAAIQWCNWFMSQFAAGKLPNGVQTPGF